MYGNTLQSLCTVQLLCLSACRVIVRNLYSLKIVPFLPTRFWT